jgi:uncharacterized membrane protein YfcA
MQVSEIPRETQRFLIAMTLIVGFFVTFILTFYFTRDVDIAKTVLAILAGAVSAIVGYFFGSKTAEESLKRIQS